MSKDIHKRQATYLCDLVLIGDMCTSGWFQENANLSSIELFLDFFCQRNSIGI